MATGGRMSSSKDDDGDRAPLLQKDIALEDFPTGRQSSGDGGSESVLSQFADLYRVEFTRRRRDATDELVSVSEDILLRLQSNEDKRKLRSVPFTATELTVDEGRHLVKARLTEGTLTRDSKWKKDVIKELADSGIEVLSWALVPSGRSADDVKQKIVQQFSGVSCDMASDGRSLMLMSQNQDQLKSAKTFARRAFPAEALHGDFKTELDIKVSALMADITVIPADCVVSAVDKGLSLSGGVSKAIAKAVDWSFKDECQSFLRTNRSLDVSKVFVSNGGQRWKKVIHACGPRWEDYPNNNVLCRQLLKETIFNCLKAAHDLKLSSIALPSISTGTFLVPVEHSAPSYMDAIEEFDKKYGEETTVNHIMFVDLLPHKISQLQIHADCSLQKDEAVRLVLIGKTGQGKSKTGNSILGQDFFQVAGSLQPVTDINCPGMVTHNNYEFKVVDTPGLFEDVEDQDRAEQIFKEVLKSVLISLPGPHVFLLLFRGDVRFDKGEAEVVSRMRELFPKDLARFLIIVFTHVEDKEELGTLLKDAPPFLKDFISECNDRVLAIDNGKRQRPPGCKAQVDEILKMAVKLREDNRAASARDASLPDFYTNDLVSRCLQVVKSNISATKTLDDIIKDVIRGDERLLNMLAEDQKDRMRSQLNQGWCSL